MVGGGHEKPDEQRMRVLRPGLELRMELTGNEKRMFGKFNYLHQLQIGARS